MADKKEAKSKRHLKEAIDVTPSQLIALLRIALKEKMRIMVCGEPGIGKSDIMAQVCDEAGVDMILNHPVVDDPTAVSGMPDLRANAEYATFKPFGNLYRALTATKPTILVLDDFGNAAPMVQASWMQYILAGRLNEHVLPDCVTIWAATNERTHMTGVTGMLEAVKDRFDAIVRLVANLED
jgi:MoxR-like ATPase